MKIINYQQNSQGPYLYYISYIIILFKLGWALPSTFGTYQDRTIIFSAEEYQPIDLDPHHP